ncbi:hypothetical protein BJ508DRAFT_375022 [Ascobolus immersus RN42]|uniref:Uncharacterized protein n=1 Tax=Ascobolus immersus RN42 TaxID=1160509 RepID=A0A3N4IH54_ASCIM|nr:hypothetical protein BJ508DRAFT_375022 [Ascobolus immersus RN42]
MHLSLIPIALALFTSVLAAPAPLEHPLLTQHHAQGHGHRLYDSDGQGYAKNFLDDDAVEKFKPLDPYRKSLANKKAQARDIEEEEGYSIYPNFGEKKKARHEQQGNRAGPRIEKVKFYDELKEEQGDMMKRSLLVKRGGKELLGKSYALMNDGEDINHNSNTRTRGQPMKQVNKNKNHETKQNRADEEAEEEGRKVLDEKWKMIVDRETKANEYERAHQEKNGDSVHGNGQGNGHGKPTGESQTHTRVEGADAAHAGNADDGNELKRKVFTSWRGEEGKKMLQGGKGRGGKKEQSKDQY